MSLGYRVMVDSWQFLLWQASLCVVERIVDDLWFMVYSSQHFASPLIYMAAIFVVTYGIALYRLRANYDLYTWYFDNTASLVLAIVGVFVPLTFLVVLIIMSCREPIYKDATPSTV